MTKRRRQTAAPAGEDHRLDPLQFPRLAAFFRGYLHEDFPVEHGTAKQAAEAFRKDASRDDREGLAREIDALMRLTRDVPGASIRTFVTRALGCRWQPASVAALAALLRSIREGEP